MKYFVLLIVLTLTGVAAPAARAKMIGCYRAQDIWVDYPERRLASDAWASYQIIPANDHVFDTAVAFIARRPAEADVICLEGVYGFDNSFHVWGAKVTPRQQLRRHYIFPTRLQVWLPMTENPERWNTPYTNVQ